MDRGIGAGTPARPGALVSLGGDIAISGAVPPGGWAIRVTHESTTPPDARIAGEDADVIAIREGAVATSSTSVRRWRRGTITVHHLIDPRTGLPARSPWRTVSVVAGTCLDANAASTAGLILGEGAPAWLESLGLAARFAAVDGSVVRVGGWPAPLEQEWPPEEPLRQELLA
jgi:thiamine biosynthesis lipoprotein